MAIIESRSTFTFARRRPARWASPWSSAPPSAVELGQGRGALTLRLGQTSGTPLANELPASGWAPVRYFHRMVRDLTEADTARPAPLPGVAIRPVRSDPDARLLHEVIEEAFAQHWAHERSDHEGWLERTEAGHKDRERDPGRPAVKVSSGSCPRGRHSHWSAT